VNDQPPPPFLDGARVLWWAWSGHEPYGYVIGLEDNGTYGLAVCQYDGEARFYRFSCDHDWEVIQDDLLDSEDEAKTVIPGNYRREDVVWRRFGIG